MTLQMRMGLFWMMAALLQVTCASSSALALDPVWRFVESLEPQGRLEDLSDKETAAEISKRSEIVDSDRMVEAQAWLEAYFSAFVAFDDTHLAVLHDKLARMSSSELKQFIEGFRLVRDGLSRQRLATDKLRQEKVDIVRRYRYKPSSARSQRRPIDVREYFVRSSAEQPRQKQYVVHAPLITSRDVARAVVHREFYGGWCR